MPVLNEDATLTPPRAMTRTSSNRSITTSALLAPSTYSQPSRLSSTASATATRRSPISTIHPASQPEISIDLLSATLDPSSPSWEKPAIKHVLLSDDPAIRKLAEGQPDSSDDDTRQLIGPTGDPLPKRQSVQRRLFPDTSRAPPAPSLAAGHSVTRRVPVPRTMSMVSNGSLQSEGSFSVRRPPAAARWSHQRERRHWTYRNASAYSFGGRSYGSGNCTSGSSWYTDTIHE